MAASVVSPLPVARVPQLLELYEHEWWTRRRTAGDVARMLAGPSITFGLVDTEGDELIGFARVLSDGAYVALILDVIVKRERRDSSTGTLLLNAVLADERLAGITSLELVCQPELIDFYRRFGFTNAVGRSVLMRRTSDPALAGVARPDRR